MTDNITKLKFEVLKAETNVAFKGIVELLEQGKRLIFVAEDLVAEELTPSQLRTIGALVKVCGSYGATLVFASEQTLAFYDRQDSDHGTGN